MKLRDVLPGEFFLSYLTDWSFKTYTENPSPASKLLDVEVVEEFKAHAEGWKSWPGTHIHVYNWWILADGHAIGWNENPSRGWSFPVIRITGGFDAS